MGFHPRDDPHLLPGLRNVQDAAKVLAQFHRGGERAALLERAADRVGGGVIDGEHRGSLGDRSDDAQS
jgi:hypothetical protein